MVLVGWDLEAHLVPTSAIIIGTIFPFPEGPILALLTSKTIFKASHLPAFSVQH